MNLGPWEIGIIVLVVLLLFGAKAVPKIGRSAGRTMREFKDSVGDMPKEFKEAVEAPAEIAGAVRNPKKAVKDAFNPFKEDDEPELGDALTDDEVQEALARRADGEADVPAPAVAAAPVAPDPDSGRDVDERIVEAEPAKPVES
jgi:TatA/E family protein of Tat protein translocase